MGERIRRKPGASRFGFQRLRTKEGPGGEDAGNTSGSRGGPKEGVSGRSVPVDVNEPDGKTEDQKRQRHGSPEKAVRPDDPDINQDDAQTVEPVQQKEKEQENVQGGVEVNFF